MEKVWSTGFFELYLVTDSKCNKFFVCVCVFFLMQLLAPSTWPANSQVN